MSWLLELLRIAVVRWTEGVAAATTYSDQVDEDADRDAWEHERIRLTLSPWWL
jgi:hypothetical protein